MNKYLLTAIWVAVFAFAVYLGVMHGIAISLAFISIIVATFFASRSLVLTSKSLELTRATTRPFLTLSGYKVILPSSRVDMEIVLLIRNTGSLPADSVSIDVILAAVNDADETERQLEKYELVKNAIYFPTIDETLHVVPSSDISKLILDEKAKIRIIMNYQHRLVKENCQTVLSYKIFKAVEGNYLFRPLPKESSWSYKHSVND
ncbi:MAG: hypothetical protein OEW82_05195 [Dehalococcoidia bacterium]|nr:hypothetical protein [Dehalococcoidia bacterium]